MGMFACCHNGFKALSRAAAKSAAAKLRHAGMLPIKIDWTTRAVICERCPLQVVHRGVSYCGKPFPSQIHRHPTEGCGCPTRAKAKAPAEHCPLTRAHTPADHSICDCKWCEGEIQNPKKNGMTKSEESGSSLDAPIPA